MSDVSLAGSLSGLVAIPCACFLKKVLSFVVFLVLIGSVGIQRTGLDPG